MTDLIWTTDVHFNFLGTRMDPDYFEEGRRNFASPFDYGQYLRATYPDADGVIISGDIAESHSIKKCLRGFAKGYGKDIFFILGNHDYYEGSWAGVHTAVGGLATTPNLHWLRQKGVIELAPDLAICGNEGWYDARAGLDPLRKVAVKMCDFDLIKELRHLHDFNRIMKIREVARHWAAEAAIHLREACAKYKNVVFVTHVPPFPDATWHQGQVSNEDWLPWMCNVTMGDMLIEVAYEFQDVSILVLCGHTHSPGEVQVSPNLRVLTGEAKYWYPTVSKVLSLPTDMPLLRR